MRRIWNSPGLWRLATLVAVAAIVVMAAFSSPFGTARTVNFLAVLQPQPGQNAGGWLVEIAPDRRVRLSPLGQTVVPAGRSLQLWTMVTQPEGLKPVGLLKPDSVNLLQPGALSAIGDDQLFAISLEPEGGSPTGQPTGPVLVMGTTKAALH